MPLGELIQCYDLNVLRAAYGVFGRPDERVRKGQLRQIHRRALAFRSKRNVVALYTKTPGPRLKLSESRRDGLDADNPRSRKRRTKSKGCLTNIGADVNKSAGRIDQLSNVEQIFDPMPRTLEKKRPPLHHAFDVILDPFLIVGETRAHRVAGHSDPPPEQASTVSPPLRTAITSVSRGSRKPANMLLIVCFPKGLFHHFAIKAR